MTVNLRAGTSGYSYKEWRGAFYPEDLPQEEWLSYYATQLPSVEINNTFYRMPKEHVVATWRDAVPDDFRFVLKASRRITHQHRLHDVEEATGYLVKRARVLGDKLGAVLFQLPPYLRCDLPRLQRFFDLLPQDLPVAFEFRHESWSEPEVGSSLAARGYGLVVTHDEASGAHEVPAAPLVYLRLRAFNYTTAALRKWHARVTASGAGQAFVFFKHEDAGAGPAMAKRFLALQPSAGPRSAPKAAAAKAVPRKAAQAARRRNTARKDQRKA